MSLKSECKKLGVVSNLEKRSESGTSHHPKSIELMSSLERIDFELGGDSFQWKTGGDGDNGETLMSHLDIHFELQDARTKDL